MSLKLKKITWTKIDERKYISNADVPQIVYRIDMGWDNALNEPTCELRFYHGYINAGVKPIAIGTANHCLEFAQRHFEQYIREEFFEEDYGY